jgi:hypothetical protein
MLLGREALNDLTSERNMFLVVMNLKITAQNKKSRGMYADPCP